MRSPFPGMDPYLEEHWGDVHAKLIVYACEQLQAKLPSDLRARAEEYLAVESEGQFIRAIVPDVSVAQRSGVWQDASAADAATIIAEPLVVSMESEPMTLRSIHILDIRSGGRVVTAIEFLSPANKKTAAGREQYRRKQQELREAGVNLVEIDLLRDGPYVLAVPEAYVPPDYASPYRISVIRASRPGMGEIYKVPLREPLPTIRIPLRPDDADVTLILQALVDQAYASGGYGADIDYMRDPRPPLKDDDAKWAAAFVRERIEQRRP